MLEKFGNFGAPHHGKCLEVKLQRAFERNEGTYFVLEKGMMALPKVCQSVATKTKTSWEAYI